MSTQRRANRTSPATELIARTSGVAGFEAAGDAREFRFLKRGLASAYTSPVSINGPAHVYHLVGMGLVELLRRKVAGVNLQGGHKLSVFRSPFRNVCRTWKPVEFAAPRWGRRPQVVGPAKHASVISSAHSHPPRPLASPPHLAAGPSRRSPLGGKVRWQKRFVFPARRMRRGLQF